MSTEDLEKYETEMELQLYREYRDIVRQFTYVVETERRFYLANAVDLQVRDAGGEVYFELTLRRRLGVGHVPAGAVREERAGADVQGRQRRGAGQARPRAAGKGRLRQLNAAGPAGVHSPLRRPQRRRPPAVGSADLGTVARCGSRTRSVGTARISPRATSRRPGCRSWRATGGVVEGELDIVARDGSCLSSPR